MKLPSSVSSRFLALGLLAGAGLFVASSASASTHVGVGVSVGVPIDNGRGYLGINVGGSDYYGRGYRHGGYYRGGYAPYIYRGHYGYRGPYYRTLPRYYTRVYVGDVLYYRANDIYYRPYEDGYVVVDAPVYTNTRVIERRVAVPADSTVVVDPNQEIGAPATNAPAAAPSAPYPDQFQVVWLGDVQYQYDKGQFFRKTAEGLVWSEPPYGAMAKKLPPDAKSVWYEQNEFWTVDGVFFRKTPDGYKVVEQPWQSAPPAPPSGKQ